MDEKPHTPARWETADDPVNHVLILRARFADDSTQEVEIPHAQVPELAALLERALRRLESEARQ